MRLWLSIFAFLPLRCQTHRSQNYYTKLLYKLLKAISLGTITKTLRIWLEKEHKNITKIIASGNYHAVSSDYISPFYLHRLIFCIFLHRAFHQKILAKLFRVTLGNFTSLDWARLQINFVKKIIK